MSTIVKLATVGVDNGANPNDVSQVSWTNPNNITLDNGTNAATVLLNNSGSHWLKATFSGFGLPGNATIQGVEFDVKCKNDSLNHSEIEQAFLLKAGAQAGSAKGAFLLPFNVEGTIPMGSGSDLWGTTVSPTDTNNNGFGVELYLHTFVLSNVNSFIYAVYGTITYTAPATKFFFVGGQDN
jgi:hypothetical protein